VRKSSGGELSSTQTTHHHAKKQHRQTTHTSRIPLPSGTAAGSGKKGNNNFMKKFDKIHKKNFERYELLYNCIMC